MPNSSSESGRNHGTKPIATSIVVAGNRLTKLLATGWRISCSTLHGKRMAREINAIVSSAQIIAAMVERAAGRIDIMAGSGVRPENAAAIRRATHADWLHSSCSRAIANESEIRHFGFGAAERRLADPERIRELKAAATSGDSL